MAELTLELLKLQEYADALNCSNCYEFFTENILTNKVHIKNLYAALNSLPAAKSLKPIDPANITFLDCIIHAYLIVTKNNITNITDCYKYYLYKKLDKKHYYSRYQTINGRERIASVYLDDYIQKNWLILKSIYDNKTAANMHILQNVQNWNENKGCGGAPLIEYPLLGTLSSPKIIKFFLIDIGVELFNYISSIPVQQQQGTILPADLLFQRFIGMTDTKIVPDMDVDKDGNLKLYSKKYNTIFGMLSGVETYESLSQEEQEEKLNDFLIASGVHGSFSNITCEDFTNFLGIINSFNESDYISGGKKEFSLGELTKNTYASWSTEARKRRPLMKMLSSIHKWGSYRFNIENDGVTRIMGFMSAKIGSENTESDIIETSLSTQNNMPEIEDSQKMVAGFHFDRAKYDAYKYEDLYSLPVIIYLDPILIEEREKYVTQAFYTNIYTQIRDDRTRTLFSYIYYEKMKNPSTTMISFNIKDLQKVFVIDTRPAKFAPLVIDSLQNLKSLNAISDFSYALKTFSVYLPKTQKLPE